ncbi:MAG: phosphatidylglycerophosphatase A [Pelagibacterales bacterium]|nr:phosphatidylglycerophosphatase A [Pelagibacterales bacterium]
MTEKNNDFDNTRLYPKKLRNVLKKKNRYVSNLINKGRIDMSSIKYHGIFLTFFGCGKWKYGPGTLTSFVTTAIWLFASYQFFLNGVSTTTETVIWTSASTIMFFYGVYIIPFYSKFIGEEDHPSIVLDEVMGQLVALSLTYPFIKPYYFGLVNTKISFLTIISHISFCFLLFRFLDIAKPSFIGKVDHEVKGGIGVMLDDLICGIVSGICGIALILVLENYFVVLNPVLD